MVLTNRCPPEFRDRAQTMLKRLKLGDGEEGIVTFRQEWYRMYCEGGLSLEDLAGGRPSCARGPEAGGASNRRAGGKRRCPALHAERSLGLMTAAAR